MVLFVYWYIYIIWMYFYKVYFHLKFCYIYIKSSRQEGIPLCTDLFYVFIHISQVLPSLQFHHCVSYNQQALIEENCPGSYSTFKIKLWAQYVMILVNLISMIFLYNCLTLCLHEEEPVKFWTRIKWKEICTLQRRDYENIVEI